MRLSLVIALAACSSSEARDLTAPTEPAKVVVAPKPVEPAPAPAPKPEAVSKNLPLTPGNSHIQVGLRTLEMLANTIDASGDDCIALARGLTVLVRDITMAKHKLAEHGQQFKTLPMSRALRDRQKAQRAFVNGCKADKLAKSAIAKSIGAIRNYDFEYGGDHAGAIY